MLNSTQEKLIRSLHTKKGREKSGKCLVEGEKVIETAGKSVDFTFTREESIHFDQLVTTDTPQDLAGVARIPEWTEEDIRARKTIVVLDGVQDPGNVGAILRLCLGFDASLVLVESVDVTNSKVVRSSVGALFLVPWISISRTEAEEYIISLQRPIFRLELQTDESTASSIDHLHMNKNTPVIIIAGSEGNGIQLQSKGTSLCIKHNSALESLNVGHAVSIILHERYRSTHDTTTA